MVTSSHILYNLALLGGKKRQSLYWAIGLGALFPDTPTILFFFITSVIQGLPHETIWHNIYFNSPWNTVFNLSHSFWLLPLLCGVGYLYKNRFIMFFFASATVHAMMDFFVHADDAYAHFYPWSTWRFHSPISYWNPAYYGNIVSLVEHAFVLCALVVLIRRAQTPRAKKLLYVVGGVEILLLTLSVLRHWFM